MVSSDAGMSPGSEYQVFLSFRGPDTREGFTDFLFHSLTDAGICVFRDDEELRVGERIDGSLQRAIDNSRIYIPVFSQNYASSQWCLRELMQIFANTSKSEDNKEIIPIFFDAEPDDVKLKTALYSDAILSLQREKELSDEQVDAWRKALKEIGAIKGWEVKKYSGHGKLIKLVVEEVVEKLKIKHRLVTEYLVGIDDQVEAVGKMLDINSGDVRLIQIHGMGGIGKTTLARVVFNQLSSHFGKCCCFLEDIREKSSRTNGLVELQNKLLSEIGHPAGTRGVDESYYGMKRIGEVLRNKKVLLVLDDVDKSKQVEKLVGKSTLYSGSRILITTRNKDVLQMNKPKYQILKYEMEMMSTDHALELFSRHAFNKDTPLDDYNNLARKIVSATGRLPLAIEVIGSLLYHKRTKEQWEKTLKELRKAPHADVFGKLKISYDALSFEQQQIFLDIACFFIGEDKTNAIYMWEDYGLLRDDGVDVLNSMCLIKIVKNEFWMHDQLRDLGREIVHKENQMNPGKRSRLWVPEEFLDTITIKEMKDVQALDLDLGKSYLKDVITSDEIGRFEHLRYLKLYRGTFVGNFANCLTKLRWIFWSNPAQPSMPTNMPLKNMVVLQISDNRFLDDSKLQGFIKMAKKLKVLSVVRCGSIIKTPDFSGCQNLERLGFADCPSLRKIDSSIGKLTCLTILKIRHCNCLEDLPEEIGYLVNLRNFLVWSDNVKRLPNSIWKLKSLRKLHFTSFPSALGLENSWELPGAIGMLQNLEELVIYNPHLKGQLPSGIGSLPFLRILNLPYAHFCGELPALPTSLTCLQVSFASLQVLPDLSNLTNLVKLNLSDWESGGDKVYIGELGWIGRLSKLTELRLRLHNVPIPIELASLPLLNQLYLFGLDMQTFPQLPRSLQKLGLDNFNLIVSLSPNLRNLSSLELYESQMQEFQLDGLQLPHIRKLHVQFCFPLERIRLSSMRKLQNVQVQFCLNLVEIQFSGAFEALGALSIQLCESLGRLVYMGEGGHDNNEGADELTSCEGTLTLPSGALSTLQSFSMSHCNKIREIQVVGTSESWEDFDLCFCPYLHSIGGLSNLKNLKSLSIYNNERLRIVKGLDELEALRSLYVTECILLERLIEVSSTKIPNDCYINISGCRKDFDGSLESYKEQELKQRRMLGRVSFQCLSFNRILHCILPCFFPLD